MDRIYILNVHVADTVSWSPIEDHANYDLEATHYTGEKCLTALLSRRYTHFIVHADNDISIWLMELGGYICKKKGITTVLITSEYNPTGIAGHSLSNAMKLADGTYTEIPDHYSRADETLFIFDYGCTILRKHSDD